MSTSSKWRLVVEARFLGWSFRQRAWADCLEDILRGLVQHRQRWVRKTLGPPEKQKIVPTGTL